MREDLDRMDIDPDQASRAVRFLRAYAATCLTEVETSVTSHSGAGRDTNQRDPADILIADAATALREAGQWLLYLDPAASRQVLSEAAHLYARLGMPYGYYLQVVSGRWAEEPPMPRFAAALDELRHVVLPPAPSGEGIDRTSEAENGMADALRHPQQQAYLLLASTGSPEVAHAFSAELRQVIGESPNRDGVIPIGSLGTPIRRLWIIARTLATGRPGELETIVRHLAAMAIGYTETMSLAQVNHHLWANAAAPVDVGDLDIAGIAALTARRYGPGNLLDAMSQSRVDEIGMAPVRAGIDLVTKEDGWNHHSM